MLAAAGSRGNYPAGNVSRQGDVVDSRHGATREGPEEAGRLDRGGRPHPPVARAAASEPAHPRPRRRDLRPPPELPRDGARQSEPRDGAAPRARAGGAPPRGRNELLLAAGYAPVYHERGLDAPEMAQVRRALEFTLRQQEPYPALVVDGRWNILMSNEGSSRLMGLFLDPAAVAALGPPNALRLFYHPRGMRPFIVNWQATAGALIQWLHRDMLRGHPETARLLDELLSYPDVPKAWRTLDPDAPAAPSPPPDPAKAALHPTSSPTLPTP